MRILHHLESGSTITANESKSGMNRERRTLFIISSVVISLVFSLCCYLKNLPVLPAGPIHVVGQVTSSLWEKASLHSDYFLKISDDARELSRSMHSRVWQDAFALDKNGALSPKHSLLSAVIAVPFFVIFGISGFWLLQQILFIGLLYSTYTLVKNLSDKALPWTTLISSCFLSQVIFYSYDYSYDLHATALIVGGLCVLQKRPFYGAALMMLSVFVKPSFVLIALPLAFATLDSASNAKHLRQSLAGSLLVLCLFFTINYLLWGSPIETAYSRIPIFDNGNMLIGPHPIGFDWNVFISDWPDKLFGSKGIFPHNLAFLAFPLLFISMKKKEHRRFKFICASSGIVYALYIFSYPMWNTTTYGNRFLLPAIFLYLILLIPSLGKIENVCFGLKKIS